MPHCPSAKLTGAYAPGDGMSGTTDVPPWRDSAVHIAARFVQPWHRGYARNKLRFDPAYAAVAALVEADPFDLLDVGCGLGLLGFHLRARGFRGDYRGIDFDAAKIAAARAAAGDEAGLVFDEGDAQGLPEFRGHVALIDVLHYLPASRQPPLLLEAAARVAPGASLIIRNVLRQPGWRFRVTALEERLLYAMGWMHSPARHFPTRAEIEAPLRAAGLDVGVRPLWGNTPFNSFMIVARRAPS
jgi:SAM-dependent methyltransferase